MFSTLTQRGAEATLEALALGATDYVTKPANVGSVTLALQRVREQLAPEDQGPGKAAGVRANRRSRRRRRRCGAAVAAGGSLGRCCRAATAVTVWYGTGPTVDVHRDRRVDRRSERARGRFCPRCPVTLPVPIVIVQHMPPMFTRLLAERLDAQCAIAVSEAVEGSPLRPGQCVDRAGRSSHARGPAWRGRRASPPESGSAREFVPARGRSSLFRSRRASSTAPSALALVLTGMGHDGLRGCEHIRRARRPRLHPGRGDQRRLGHARLRRPRRARRAQPAARTASPPELVARR